jgi:hypothetical protein
MLHTKYLQAKKIGIFQYVAAKLKFIAKKILQQKRKGNLR